MEVLFSISLALVAGLLISRVVKPLKLPAVTGYLIAGILIGPYCLGQLNLPEGFDVIGMLHTTEGVEQLGIISKVALGFIAFAIGTERISRQIDGLDFIPLLEERFDLVIKKETLETAPVQKLLQLLQAPVFQKEIARFSGNDYRDMGKIICEV